MHGGSIGHRMRGRLTRDGLRAFMKELARTAPARKSYRVYFVGGVTAVDSGWRQSTIDVDLTSNDDAVFRDVQNIKERLQMNIEFARPEDFVPPLDASDDRHLFIETRNFVRSGMVDPARFQSLVRRIPERSFAKYPALSRQAVLSAVQDFLDRLAG
jgi:hypothetical protein